MFRTDNSTSVASPPTLPAVGTPGYFSNGNPVAGSPPTVVDDWWMNMLQQEIETVVTRAGLTLLKTDNTQLWQALQRNIATGIGGYIVMTGPLDLYVATTGNDTTGDGSAGNPFATPQHAYDYLITHYLDFGAYPVTIHLANGTYGPLNMIHQFGGQITFTGNVASPESAVISTTDPNKSAVNLRGTGLSVNLQNLTVIASAAGGSGGAGIGASGGAVLTFGNLVFGLCTFAHIFSSQGGLITALSNYQIANPSPVHALATLGANILMSSTAADLTVTLDGIYLFSQEFAASIQGSSIYAPRNIFSGPGATGARYLVQSNGIIDASGHGASYFPGSAAGSAGSGGQYV